MGVEAEKNAEAEVIMMGTSFMAVRVEAISAITTAIFFSFNDFTPNILEGFLSDSNLRLNTKISTKISYIRP